MNPTNRAAADIMEILMGLPTPRHAAAAIATVRANLWLQGGATSTQEVAKLMNNDDNAALEVWNTVSSALKTAQPD